MPLRLASGMAIAIGSTHLLQGARAAASGSIAGASASWPLCLALGALLLALLLAGLAWWQPDPLLDAWDWLAETVGGLIAPLRSRRHVIHDPTYLQQIIRAERTLGPEAPPPPQPPDCEPDSSSSRGS